MRSFRSRLPGACSNRKWRMEGAARNGAEYSRIAGDRYLGAAYIRTIPMFITTLSMIMFISSAHPAI